MRGLSSLPGNSLIPCLAKAIGIQENFLLSPESETTDSRDSIEAQPSIESGLILYQSVFSYRPNGIGAFGTERFGQGLR